MFRFIKFQILLSIIIGSLTAVSGNTYAYQSEEHPTPYVVDNVDCNDEERSKELLDYASIEAKKDEVFFIIAHLGSGESSRNLIKRRLFAPKDYLMKTRGVSEDRIIVAEGERVKGLGHVKVYIGSKLFILFKMKRYRDFGQGPLCKIAF
jgi:hypothetical protein